MFIILFVFNEIARHSKICRFLIFFVLTIVLYIVWFTVLKDKIYTDWFHLVKVYYEVAGCIRF